MKKFYTTFALCMALTVSAQDGILDATFGNNGIHDIPLFPYLTDMKIDSNGKIIIAGGQNDNIILYRYNPDGTIDSTFDNDGIKEIDLGATFSVASSIALDVNNNIIIATNGYGKIVKLLGSNGDFDASFGTNGILTYATDYDKYVKVSVDFNNRVVVCSYQFDSTINFNFLNKLQRFDANGLPDVTFNSGNVVNFNYSNGTGSFKPSYIKGLQIQNDNKIIVAITENTNVPFGYAIRRYNENGTIDNSFNVDVTGVSVDGYLTNTYYDGTNLYCSAANTSPNVYYTASLIKYNDDGTNDTTFDSDGIANVIFGTDYYNVTYGISIQPDGKKIISATSLSQTSGALSNLSIARLHLDGSLDTTFGINGTTSVALNTSGLVVNYCAINPANGKLYALTFNGSGAFGLYRFNTGISTLSNTNYSSVKAITLTPNPTSAILNFQTNQKVQALKITDISGRTTVIEDFADNSIDVSDLSDGIYFVEMTFKSGIYREKFIKN